jgi:hypothetical protein
MTPIAPSPADGRGSRDRESVNHLEALAQWAHARLRALIFTCPPIWLTSRASLRTTISTSLDLELSPHRRRAALTVVHQVAKRRPYVRSPQRVPPRSTAPAGSRASSGQPVKAPPAKPKAPAEESGTEGKEETVASA